MCGTRAPFRKEDVEMWRISGISVGDSNPISYCNMDESTGEDVLVPRLGATYVCKASPQPANADRAAIKSHDDAG